MVLMSVKQLIFSLQSVSNQSNKLRDTIIFYKNKKTSNPRHWYCQSNG